MPSNNNDRPVLSASQTPNTPATSSIDDFLQISDAARANIGEETINDLMRFVDQAGYTQTSGSFRITEGGIEMASVPRQSINNQTNIYIGSLGDEIVEGNLRRPGTRYGYAKGSAGPNAPSGIEGTAGIKEGFGTKGNIVMTQNLPEGLGPRSGYARVGGLVGNIAHELTHIADSEAGLSSGQLRSINSNINQTAISIHDSINLAREEFEKGNYRSIDEAMRASGVLEAHQEFGRAVGTVESLADTGKISSLRRVTEQDPELGRRLGFSSISNVVDSVVKEGELASAYTRGGFRDATVHAGTLKLLQEAGVSQELIDEINHSSRVIASATYASRTGGVESEALDQGLETQARRSYLEAEGLTDEQKVQYGRLFDEEYQSQKVKGRFNIDVLDDISEAAEKLESERPKLNIEAPIDKPLLDTEVSARVTGDIPSFEDAPLMPSDEDFARYSGFDEDMVNSFDPNENVIEYEDPAPKPKKRPILKVGEKTEMKGPARKSKTKPGAKAGATVTAESSSFPSAQSVAQRASASRATRRGVVNGNLASAAVASGTKGSNNLRVAAAGAAIGIGAYGINKLRSMGKDDAEYARMLEMQRHYRR